MRLAYACSWWRPIETTWSGSSAALMNAIAARADVDLVRIDAQQPRLVAASLMAYGRTRSYGVWKHSVPNRRLTDARVRRRLRGVSVDAVLAVADVEPVLDLPTFLYQDANFSTIDAHLGVMLAHAPALFRYPDGRLAELIAEQRAVYQASETIFTFGEWFADWLVKHDGVAPDRVQAVGGGIRFAAPPRRIEQSGAGGRRVLFVGREFHRKGGDLVVTAIERLRASGSGDFRLTVVGPATWPLTTPVPEWVDFRGELPAAEVSRFWAEHDIFAMPTWYEPYGIVFLEARAAGVPCIGRNAFCMPELVPPDAGRLIPEDGGAEDVAEQLASISTDAELFVSVAAGVAAVRQEYSWDRVAARVSERMRSVVDGPR